jgi:hypothetical protein
MHLICNGPGVTATKTTPPNKNPCPQWRNTHKIATLNVFGISATRIKKLEDFLYVKEIDLICLQEFTNSHIKTIRCYAAYINRIRGQGNCNTNIILLFSQRHTIHADRT